jgi:V8-like Glu-specific endopeptidase
MKRFLVLIALLMTGPAHAGVIVGTAYCTGIQVADCAMDGGVLTDVNGSCFCDTSPPAPPSDDEREIVTSPTTFPWYTAVKVDIGPTGGGRGSAMLISDCTMLTVGHAVFAPATGTWLNIEEVHPGHYYNNSTNTGIDPFGSKSPLTTATNNKWVDGKGSDYDYGAIFLSSSFRSTGITTFIPLAFEDKPDYINSAGYPSAGLPSSAAGANRSSGGPTAGSMITNRAACTTTRPRPAAPAARACGSSTATPANGTSSASTSRIARRRTGSAHALSRRTRG